MHSTADAAKFGIAMIHQENSLVQHLTVYENIYLGHFIKKGMFVDKKSMRDRAKELLKKLHLDWIDPNMYVKELSSSEQQLIEIAKALSTDPETIIFDEPTASLTVRESEILMGIIREPERKKGRRLYLFPIIWKSCLKLQMLFLYCGMVNILALIR